MKLRWLWVYPAAVLVASLLVLVETWPWHPHTKLGWLIFVALSAPICLIFGFLEQVLDKDPLAAKVEVTTKDKPISSFRMTYYFLRFAFICALGVGAIVVVAKLSKHWRPI